jgi:hypothetical protein
MKSTIFIFVFIALAVTFVACKRKSTEIQPQDPGMVVFPAAGVSLDAGTDWKRVDTNPGLPVCPPTLVGPAGMVRAMLFAPRISDMQTATNAVRSMFGNDTNAARDSYHQEDFTTDSGLHGQHIFYSRLIQKSLKLQ